MPDSQPLQGNHQGANSERKRSVMNTTQTAKVWTELPTGQTHGAFSRLMVAFGDRVEEATTRINSDEAFARRIAQLCFNNGYELTTSQARAKEIMGKNFLGVEEGMKLFGIRLSRRQFAYMSEIPFSEATLTACKDTHILVAVLPLAIVQIRSYTAAMKLSKGQKSFFYKHDWYDRQAFANEVGQLEWRLVRKTPVENSTSKTWQQQQELLDSKIEETPMAQVMVYTIIGHFLNTGERLFEKVYVRTSSLDSDGDRVGVGSVGADGLIVNYVWDGCAYGPLAVSSSRKLES